MSKIDQLRVVLATPLAEKLCKYIETLEPRVKIVREHSLLPTMRWAADHSEHKGFSRNPAQQQIFEEMLNSADALLGIPDGDPKFLARIVCSNPHLKWVHTMAAGGGEQVKVASLTSEELERVKFTTSVGVHGAPLAEFAVFGVLAGAKSLPRLQEQKENHEWSGRWCMKQLSEMTIGVLGLGNIGKQITTRLAALGANVIGINRPISDFPELIESLPPSDLISVVSRLDALVVALPGTEATRSLVNAEVFSAVRPGITIVNVGRGTVIDEIALVSALKDERVGFAALDVFETEPLPFESPLWTHPNVLISPHTAALNQTEDKKIAELFARNAALFLDDKPMVNVVDTVEFF